jgi:hypothetical protein
VDIPVDKRVVLEIKGNLLFSGIARGAQTVNGRRGIVVETDPTIGLAVFCPEESIQEITIIPMPREEA